MGADKILVHSHGCIPLFILVIIDHINIKWVILVDIGVWRDGKMKAWKKNSKMKNEDVKGRYLPQTKAKAKLDYASHGTDIFRIGQY